MKARLTDLRESWRASKASETLRKAALPALVRSYIPILQWFRKYPRGWFRPDAIGGLTTWAVMIPAAKACTPPCWRWRPIPSLPPAATSVSP